MKLRRIPEPIPPAIDAILITPNFGSDRSDWPDWLNRAYHDSPQMVDGGTPTGAIYNDGGELLIGGKAATSVGRVGEYLIRTEGGDLGVATKDVLFAKYEEIPMLESV